MLAWVLAMGLSLCLSACLCACVACRYRIEMDARNELDFHVQVSFNIATLFIRKSRLSSKIRILPSGVWNFVPSSGHGKFRHGTHAPTVSECDINSDSERSAVDSARRRRADSRRAWQVQSTADDDCRLLIALGV